MSKSKIEVPYVVVVEAFSDIQSKINQLEERYFLSKDSEEKQMLSIKIQGYEAIIDQMVEYFRIKLKTPSFAEENYNLNW